MRVHKNLVGEALSEKDRAVELWTEIRDDFKDIQMDDTSLREFIENSIEYGLLFFTIVRLSFYMFAKYRKQESVTLLLKEYDETWASYRELEQRPQASTSFREDFRSQNPQKGNGWNEVVEYCREKLCF